MAVEIDLGSMHWSQPLIAMGKREKWWVIQRQNTRKCAEHFASWEGKDVQVLWRAYTRIGARTDASTITIIIGQTRKCFGLAQPW
jgi:hypothetical protein